MEKQGPLSGKTLEAHVQEHQLIAEMEEQRKAEEEQACQVEEEQLQREELEIALNAETEPSMPTQVPLPMLQPFQQHSGSANPKSTMGPGAIQPATTKSSRRFGLGLLALVALVILLTISRIGGGVVIYQNHLNQVSATATTTAIAYNPYLSSLSGNRSSTLAFVDPLSQESESKWSSTNNTFGACQLTGGAYHVIEQDTRYFNGCSASGTFSNFAFEVQLTIIKGDCGGIGFRNDGNGHFYIFDICQNGNYWVYKHYVSQGDSEAEILISGSNFFTQMGMGQQNKIAILANGSQILFYAHGHEIAQVEDSSYTSGSIELIASPWSNATDVAYTNAKLWIL